MQMKLSEKENHSELRKIQMNNAETEMNHLLEDIEALDVQVCLQFTLWLYSTVGETSLSYSL